MGKFKWQAEKEDPGSFHIFKEHKGATAPRSLCGDVPLSPSQELRIISKKPSDGACKKCWKVYEVERQMSFKV